DRPALAAPVSELKEDVDVTVPLTPNQPARLMVKATNARGSPRTEFVDMVYVPRELPPPPPPRKPHMVVLSIGSDQFACPDLTPLRFAAEDAEGLADLFTKHLIPHNGSQPFDVRPEDRVVLTGTVASVASISKAFDQLRTM